MNCEWCEEPIEPGDEIVSYNGNEYHYCCWDEYKDEIINAKQYVWYPEDW